MISDLSQKFKHDLWRVKSELKLSQKQHLTPGEYDGLAPNRRQAIIWTKDGLFFYMSHSPNEFNESTKDIPAVNIIAADDLAMAGAKASAAIILNCIVENELDLPIGPGKISWNFR